MPKKKQKVWIMTGQSESGDEYGPKIFKTEPRTRDKVLFILNNTPEDFYEDEDEQGPGFLGTYVHIEVTEGEA